MTDVHRLGIGAAAVKLIAQNDRIVAHVRSGNGFEPQTRALWGAWCAEAAAKPGEALVLDIGACAGLFAIGAVLLGCKAYAFEPMAFNAERLKANRALNRVSFRLFHNAVSNHNGFGTMIYNPNVTLTQGASLVAVNAKKKTARKLVKTLTIDSLDLSRVDCVKIDVEHGELLVLAGMKKTLRRCRPKLIVEALSDEEKAAVCAALPDYIRADTIDRRNLVLLPA